MGQYVYPVNSWNVLWIHKISYEGIGRPASVSIMKTNGIIFFYIEKKQQKKTFAAVLTFFFRWMHAVRMINVMENMRSFHESKFVHQAKN